MCLCTSELRRVHRICSVSRGSQRARTIRGGLNPCPTCGLTNQYARLSDARRKARVVIVGAGPAGLAAAQYLRERGVEPLVLEARTRLGGRIDTVQMGDFNVDLGAAYIHGCDAMYNPVNRHSTCAWWPLACIDMIEDDIYMSHELPSAGVQAGSGAPR